MSKITNVLKFMFSNEDTSDLEELQLADISDDADWYVLLIKLLI